MASNNCPMVCEITKNTNAKVIPITFYKRIKKKCQIKVLISRKIRVMVQKGTQLKWK